MALQVWLPFDKDTHNQGIFDKSPSFSALNCSIIDSGKLGKCLKTTTSGNIDTYYTPKFNVSSISFGGWFKFNKEEIQNAIGGLNYTSSATAATGNLIGNCSYGGIGLVWSSNNMYSSGKVLSSINIFGNIRTPSINYNTNQITINFDEWIHIFYVLNRDKNEMYLYKNGELFNTVHLNSYSDWVERYLQINRGAIYGGNGPAACIPYCANDLRIYDHCLSGQEVKDISMGLVAHYQLKDSAIESTTNLVTSLVAGGQTSLSSDKLSVITTGSSSDTYFRMNLSEALVQDTKYTFSFDCFGTKGNLYPYAFDNNGSYLMQVHEGHNEYTFTANSSVNGKTQVLFDDRTPSVLNSLIFSHIQLEKKDHATLYTIISRTGITKVYDSSGFGNHALVSGTPTVTNDSAKYSLSTFFNQNGYINNENFAINLDTFTLNMWINPKTMTTSQHFLFGTFTSWTGHGIGIWRDSTNASSYRCLVKSNAESSFSNMPITTTLNNWNMLTLVYNGTSVTGYCNGVQQYNVTYGLNGKVINYNLMLANSKYNSTSASENDEVAISDFRLYVTALSAEDVKNLYQTAAHAFQNGYSAYEFVEG